MTLQTLIPCLTPQGILLGAFLITPTDLTNVGVFNFSEGSVSLTWITYPVDATNPSGLRSFYAYVTNNPSQLPGFSSFVPADITNYQRWNAPQVGGGLSSQQNNLLEVIRGGFYSNRNLLVVPSSSGTTPTQPNTWEITLAASSLEGITFVDFDWTLLIAGTSILPTSNPTGMKAIVVGTSNQNNLFNTVRILLLTSPTPGTYSFGFLVTQVSGTVTATLNLIID